jgi:hypothetical protein
MPNDYFLTKIYESMKNKKDSSSLSKPKNIQQAYYQVVLKQINEGADILMQNRDESGKPYGNVEEFAVSDDVASEIRANIRKGQTVKDKFGRTTNLREIIEEVLKRANLESKNKNEFNFLVDNVVSIFNKENLVLDNIVNYKSLLSTSPNTVVEKLINKPFISVNLMDLVPDWFKSFFEDKNISDVISALWDIKPSGSTNLGRGELLFTLISNTKKAGDEGDLIMDNKKIELKGAAGSMGGDGFVQNISTELNNIIKTDLTKLSISNRKKEILKKLDKELSIKKRQLKKMSSQEIERFEIFKKEFLKLIDELNESYDENSIQNIKDFLNSGPVDDENIKNDILQIIIVGLKIPKNNYRDALLAFFSQYKLLTDDQIVEGIFAARNYTNVPSKENTLKVLKNIFLKDKNILLQEGREREFTNPMKKLIGALHICVYQEIHKFKSIIFANDENKNMLNFNFNGTSAAENLEDIYNVLNRFNPEVHLSMSGLQKAAGFTFFKSSKRQRQS